MRQLFQRGQPRTPIEPVTETFACVFPPNGLIPSPDRGEPPGLTVSCLISCIAGPKFQIRPLFVPRLATNIRNRPARVSLREQTMLRTASDGGPFRHVRFGPISDIGRAV